MGRRDERDSLLNLFFNFLFLTASCFFNLEQFFVVRVKRRGEDKSNKTICHLFHFFGNELNQASRDQLEIVIGFRNNRRDLTLVFSV